MDLVVTAEEMSDPGTVRVDLAADAVKRGRKCPALGAIIDYIIENPCMMTELSAKQMAKCSKEYRQSYAMTKIINAKKRAYHQALIEQRSAYGFAYDEVEVTDDDENDEEEVAVVKN